MQEILAWSASLLTGEEPDDMDGAKESLAGYRSTMRGVRPETSAHAAEAEETAALVSRVEKWIASGVEAEHIGIAVRFVQFGRDIAGALERAGIAACVLGAGRSGPGVRIGTMHRMKGLDFRCVTVAGVNDGTVPVKAAVAPVDVHAQQHQDGVNSELSLMFVACTQAREALRVSWHGDPGPFLAPVTGPCP
ncbi:3'-5' exonuclease [Streptomyces badius]